MLTYRKNANPKQCHKAAAIIQSRVIRTIETYQLQRIGLYLPVQQEVDTQMIIQHAWDSHCDVFIPKVGPTLEFSYFTPKTKLKKNVFHCLEADHDQSLLAEQLDCIICPLIAFNNERFRLGYGGGYYDKTFSAATSLSPHLWGMAYDWQKREDWSPEPHDKKLTKIFTEKTTY